MCQQQTGAGARSTALPVTVKPCADKHPPPLCCLPCSVRKLLDDQAERMLGSAKRNPPATESGWNRLLHSKLLRGTSIGSRRQRASFDQALPDSNPGPIAAAAMEAGPPAAANGPPAAANGLPAGEAAPPPSQQPSRMAAMIAAAVAASKAAKAAEADRSSSPKLKHSDSGEGSAELASAAENGQAPPAAPAKQLTSADSGKPAHIQLPEPESGAPSASGSEKPSPVDVAKRSLNKLKRCAARRGATPACLCCHCPPGLHSLLPRTPHTRSSSPLCHPAGWSPSSRMTMWAGCGSM